MPSSYTFSPRAPRTLDLKDFATGNGTTVDTVALQAAINTVTGAAAGVPAVRLLAGPGTYKFDNTVYINRKAVIVIGSGVGNTTEYSNPGKGTTFKWSGATGGYMFDIQDATNGMFQDILFLGNSTNPPAAFIHCVSAGGGSGLNERLTYSRCQFGSWPWASQTPAATLCATAAIVYDGTNANNDKPILRDCRFADVGVGLDLVNTQSEWGVVDNCYFSNCSTAGIRTASNLTIVNATFQGCAKDIVISSTAKVESHSAWSENAVQHVYLSGQGTYNSYGGKFLASASTGTNWIQHDSAGANGGLGLYGFQFDDQGGTYTGKQIYVRGASGATTMGQVTIVGCTGIVSGMLDVAAGAAGAGLRLFVKTANLDFDYVLRYSKSLATVGAPPRGELLGGGGEASVPRRFAMAQAAAQASGTLTLGYFQAQRDETINNLAMITSTTAAASLTLCRLAVYSVADNGDLTLVASTASDTALFAATSTRYQKALSAPWNKVAGQMYAIGHLAIGTTMPVVYGDNAQGASVVSTLRGIDPRLAGSVASQTDLLSTYTAASVGVSRSAGYVEMLP